MNTLYLTVAIVIAPLFAAASTLTLNDEQRANEMYCSMSQEGHWPRGAAAGFCQ